MLRTFVLLSLALLLTAAVTSSGPLRYLGISVATAGVFFWGLPYYGQGLSFAPGDGVVILGLSVLILLSKRLRNLPALVTFSAIYGAVVTYFEFLTGQLPTAACFLFVAAYLLPSSSPGASESGHSRWNFAFCSLFAFASAAILTVAIKLALAAALIGTDVNQLFWENLSLYSGSLPSAGGFITTLPHAIVQLLRATPVLTYARAWGAVALLAATTAAWLAAAFLAVRLSRYERGRFLAHLLGAAGVLAWISILPTHAAIHAAFMVRILIVPVTLGWSALLNEMFNGAGLRLWRGQAA